MIDERMAELDSLVTTGLPDPARYRRRPTRLVMVGDVGVGADQPIRVQSMTTTRTLDTAATVAQVERLARAGCEIVRITAPTVEEARNLGAIRAELRRRGVRVPLVADIHFHPAAALEAANHVEKVRINPGNYADSKRFLQREYTDAEYAAELERIRERFLPLVRRCKTLGVAMRIGTNHGSLSDRIMNRFGDTPLGMVESALEFVRICRDEGYHHLILSMKASNPKVAIAAYRLLAARMAAEGMDYPFHLGVTEAGAGEDGRVKSAIGIGSLLDDGIGDTIRVSLTEEPEAEVPVAFRLVAPYNALIAAARATGAAPAPAIRAEARPIRLTFDPFSYSRRAARAVDVGPCTLGDGNPPLVLRRLEGSLSTISDPFARVRGLQGRSRLEPGPDVIELCLYEEADLQALRELHARLAAAGLAQPLAVALPALADWAEQALGGASLLRPIPPAGVPLRSWLARAVELAARHRLPLLIEVEPSHWALGFAPAPGTGVTLDGLAEALGVCRAGRAHDLVLSVRPAEGADLVRSTRALADALQRLEARHPLLLQVPALADPEETRLRASVVLGSLLCDGIGDAVAVVGGEDWVSVRLAFTILQGAGARITRAEFVSCPSCGRTLFDLQTTTERIRQRTGHLTGVKIAIMGCIVNGPGEMADADFGYVGGSPGRVNLYVGKQCVEKGVPEEEADDRLVELIRRHGRWVDPPETG